MHFVFNAETAVNNSFQVMTEQTEVTSRAIGEFDAFVTRLQEQHIEVTVVEDSSDPHTPDAIFPNNWISFHESGVYCLYPMFASNRRKERKQEVLQIMRERFNYVNLIDFTSYESENLFLEGTGSMVLDRVNRLAYACLSPRTNNKVLEDFCSRMNYRAVVFHATDTEGMPIYHTNVLMCVADSYVVICLETVEDTEEKQLLTETIAATGKHLVSISRLQMNQFAGNMLQLENTAGEKILVMSTSAWTSMDAIQQQYLSSINRIVHSSLQNIETNGGGSARCMIAEIHL